MSLHPTTNRRTFLTALACAALLGFSAAVPDAASDAPAALTLVSGRVSLTGTSNIHPFEASTTDVRLVRVQLANGTAGAGALDTAMTPGALEAFEIAIPVAKLSSPKDGLDKNMHKALKATEFPDIGFRLTRMESAAAGLRAIGMLRVAGVEKEVALDLRTERNGATLSVKGELTLMMTDFGIAPPKAMLGMLKTDPKIIVKFETVLAAPLT